MEVKKLIEILDKNINQQQLAKDIGNELLLPMLIEFTQKTENPYDDKLVEFFKKFIETK